MIKITGNLLKEFADSEKKKEQALKQKLVKELAANTPIDTGEAREGWKLEGDKIVNPVDHIENLNDGSSKQAPAYFIEQTLLAQKGIHPNGTIVRPMT
jgi:hypothetical protein